MNYIIFYYTIYVYIMKKKTLYKYHLLLMHGIILYRSRRLHHKLEVKTLLLSVEPNAITVKSVLDLIPNLPQVLCPLVMLMPLVIPLNLLVRLKNVLCYKKLIIKEKNCKLLLWSFRAKMVVTRVYNINTVQMFFNQEEDYI